MDLVTLESDTIIRCLDQTNIRPFLEVLRFGTQEGDKHSRSSICSSMSGQAQKATAVINALRQNAIAIHQVDEKEYITGALLKTLEILSYKLPPDQNGRATTYVSYLCDRIRQLLKG